MTECRTQILAAAAAVVWGLSGAAGSAAAQVPATRPAAATSPAKRAQIVKEIAPPAGELDKKSVMFGGPVQVERGFVLHAPHGNFSSMMTVTDDIALTTSKDVLESVASGDGPRRVLVTLGCAGWSAGQLEQEIGRNGWLTVRADPAIIFDMPVEERPVPDGIIMANGDYYYAENPPGTGVRSVGMGEHGPSEDEKTKEEVKNELF